MTAFVKAATGGGWFGVSPLTIPIVTAGGNTLVVSTTITAGVTPTITDTAGNVWVKAASTADVAATGQRLGCVYYCVNAKPVTSVSLSSASNQNWAAVVSEWSGVTGSRAVQAANTPTGSVPVAANAGDLVLSSVFYYQADGTPAAPPTGWASAGAHATGNNFHSDAYQVATTAGNVGASWSMPSTARAIITTAFAGATVTRRPWKLITASGPVPLAVRRL